MKDKKGMKANLIFAAVLLAVAAVAEVYVTPHVMALFM